MQVLYASFNPSWNSALKHNSDRFIFYCYVDVMCTIHRCQKLSTKKVVIVFFFFGENGWKSQKSLNSVGLNLTASCLTYSWITSKYESSWMRCCTLQSGVQTHTAMVCPVMHQTLLCLPVPLPKLSQFYQLKYSSRNINTDFPSRLYHHVVTMLCLR